MKREAMEELLVFPQEIPVHEALFEQMPLWIVRKYLECFDSKGRQARIVPRHMLEALAKRFLLVTEGTAKSLDEAFGGRVRRQRNRLHEMDRQWSVLWALMQTIEEVKAEPRSARGKGSPFEIAVERVAEELGMSPDNVRRIYKQTGKR
ncbi:MAG TPA: hypothetical protein VGW40_03315 [Allosphingosinicella sp.]|nr:hypothetical protein [Allosphingosinicella sp.]